MRPRILVVGSMNMDLFMYGLNELPRWSESTFATEYGYAAGGKGANQALAIARQGADCYMLGRVGADDNGRTLLDSLERSGVHTDFVAVDPELRTGMSTMNMGNDGRYFSIYVPGANTAMRVADLDAAHKDSRFDMIVMQLEMPREMVRHICALGRRTGMPVFLDAGPAMAFPLEALRGAFVISPNEAETRALTGIAPDTDAGMAAAAEAIYRQARPGYVLLKLGERGAYLYSDGEQRLIPGYRVQAVDTTAAGDTFGAAFCVRRCQGAPVLEAIRYAHAAAAICVTRKGGHPSIPTAEETEAFLRENG